MILIGIQKGEYQGHAFGRIICLENMNLRNGCRGDNAVVSKCKPELIDQIAPEFELYKGQEVIISYDRFGKAQKIDLA